jgi:hypothetical protein
VKLGTYYHGSRRAYKKKDGEFEIFIKNKLDRKFKNWRGGGTERERERRSEREGELKPRKWEREKKSEREGDLFFKNMKRERYSESEGEL